MDSKNYKFGMDWLNGVLPVEDVSKVFEMLAMFSSKLRFERWELVNSGKYNYRRRYCLDGGASIQLMYNPVSDDDSFTACRPDVWIGGSPVSSEPVPGTHHNPYIFFSISGDGIRYLNSLGGEVSALNKLLFYFYRNGFKCSRFDVYCDILDKDNEIIPLLTEAFSYFGQEQVGKPFLSTNIRRNRKNVSMFRGLNDDGSEFWNCTLGSHGNTSGMFRSYNKLVEVSDGRLFDFSSAIFDSYGVSDYWYRLEYEMHKDNAAGCFNTLMEKAESCNSPLCFEDIFFCVFNKLFSVSYASTLSKFQHANYTDVPVWSEFRDYLLNNAEYFV